MRETVNEGEGHTRTRRAPVAVEDGLSYAFYQLGHF
jgi:hypothetical protein